MKIDGIGNLCLWCMEEMGENSCCPHCGHDEREPQRVEQAIPAGQIIGGHYLIGRTLGQGGFGITYLAYDLDLHIKRAIKECFPRGLVTRVGNTVQVSRRSEMEVFQKGVDSFYREAQAIARTQTPTSTPKPTATVKAQSVITDEIRNAQVGDHVYYGHYEQDNNLSNGAEAIEWRVLAREGNRLLLISEYGLDAKRYNERFVDITWEDCTLRSWLIGAFYQSAFSAE